MCPFCASLALGPGETYGEGGHRESGTGDPDFSFVPRRPDPLPDSSASVEEADARGRLRARVEFGASYAAQVHEGQPHGEHREHRAGFLSSALLEESARIQSRLAEQMAKDF